MFDAPSFCAYAVSLIHIYSLCLGISALIAYHVMADAESRRGRKVPRLSPAGFKNLWAMYHARQRQFSEAVDLARQKYGNVIRIQPRHYSIADANAVQAVYGHGNGFLTSYSGSHHFYR